MFLHELTSSIFSFGRMICPSRGFLLQSEDQKVPRSTPKYARDYVQDICIWWHIFFQIMQIFQRTTPLSSARNYVPTISLGFLGSGRVDILRETRKNFFHDTGHKHIIILFDLLRTLTSFPTSIFESSIWTPSSYSRTWISDTSSLARSTWSRSAFASNANLDWVTFESPTWFRSDEFLQSSRDSRYRDRCALLSESIFAW